MAGDGGGVRQPPLHGPHGGRGGLRVGTEHLRPGGKTPAFRETLEFVTIYPPPLSREARASRRCEGGVQLTVVTLYRGPVITCRTWLPRVDPNYAAEYL